MTRTLEELREKIKNGDYLNAEKNDWGGAGIIITDDASRSHRKSDILIVTDRAKYIIWLLEELKPIAEVDYLSKYEYYEVFAKTVKEENEKNIDVKALLENVLKAMEKYL